MGTVFLPAVATERLTVLGGFERVEVVEMGGLGVGDIDMAVDFGGSALFVEAASLGLAVVVVGLTVEVVVAEGARD